MKSVIQYIVSFLLFFGIQVLLLKDFVLFGYASCFVYLGFLLFLSLGTGPLTLLIVGVISGAVIDIFEVTPGLHASAAVLVAFLRPYLIRFLEPPGGFETFQTASIKNIGVGKVIIYITTAVFIHHSVIFILGSGTGIFNTILSIITSTLFTSIVLIPLLYLTFSYRRIR